MTWFDLFGLFFFLPSKKNNYSQIKSNHVINRDVTILLDSVFVNYRRACPHVLIFAKLAHQKRTAQIKFKSNRRITYILNLMVIFLESKRKPFYIARRKIRAYSSTILSFLCVCVCVFFCLKGSLISIAIQISKNSIKKNNLFLFLQLLIYLGFLDLVIFPSCPFGFFLKHLHLLYFVAENFEELKKGFSRFEEQRKSSCRLVIVIGF